MSLTDDQTAEIDEIISQAFDKAQFGDIADRVVFRVATKVLVCREILRGSDGDIDFTKPLNSVEQRILLRTAGLLLIGAIRDKENLGLLQKALTENPSPNIGCQFKAIEAYRACPSFPPTLREVQQEFLRRHPPQLLPKDFALRKMITKTLRLPLGRAKLGRPTGAKSVIRNQEG